MSGSLVVPVVLGNEPAGNNNLSDFDGNFDAITQYVNVREVTVGLLVARPAFGTSGRYYFATDVNGGTFYVDTGTGWSQLAAGVTQPAQDAFVQVLVGCTLSNDGGSPLTILDVSAGGATSDDATLSSRVLMTLAALTGTTAGTWVVGTGQPKLDAGAVGASTWYHVYVIKRVDTGVTDILFSTNPTAPTMPTNYTKKRRIGSFKTDGASHILAFTQTGDLFQWLATVQDLSAANPGTSAVTATLASIPTGVKVRAITTVGLISDTANAQAYLSDLSVNDEAASATAAPGSTVTFTTAGSTDYAKVDTQTNTSAQIRYRLSLSTAATTIKINTLGWYDRRGQDA